MHPQRRGDQEQQRWRAGELASGKVAVAGELAVLLMPAHPRPIVESLQRQVNVLIGLQFQNSQRPSSVQVSTSSMARSEAAKAGTCE